MLTLTATELRELTGYRQPTKQRAWLVDRLIPFRDEGRILVSRAAAERWLAGIEAPKSKGPNLALVK